MEKKNILSYKFKYTMVMVLIAVVALILFASFLRHLNMYVLGFSPVRSFIQSFIYIGIFMAWGISLKNRIINRPVRRMLISVDALMLLWMVARTIKYLMVNDPDLIRYLWYSYYIQILMIPFFCVRAALFLGRPDDYRLSGRMNFLFGVGIVLVVTVLTNDLHQLFFRFGDSSPVYSEKDYTRGMLYYAGMIYTAVLAVLSFAIMIKRCRIYRNRKLLFIPLGALGFITAYCVVHVTNSEIVKRFLGDFPVTICLLVMITLEGCIQAGLIRSNTGYFDLLKQSMSGIRILDAKMKTVYVADTCSELDDDTVKEIVTSGQVLTGDDIMIKSHHIAGGYVLWSEDLSELNAMISELEEVKNDLSDSVNLQKEKYEAQREAAVLRERNRLYQMILMKVRPQLEYLRAELDHAQNTVLPKDKLLKLAVLATYVKRMGNLILISEMSGDLDVEELALCFEESFESLRLVDVPTSFVNKNVTVIGFSGAAKIYETFEQILETVLPDLRALQVVLASEEGGDISFRMSIEDEEKEGTPDMDLIPCDVRHAACEDGSHTFILRLREGE